MGPTGLPLPAAAAAGLPSAVAAAAAALAAACSCSVRAKHLESRAGSGAFKLITWVGNRLAMGLCLFGRSGLAAALPCADLQEHVRCMKTAAVCLHSCLFDSGAENRADHSASEGRTNHPKRVRTGESRATLTSGLAGLPLTGAGGAPAAAAAAAAACVSLRASKRCLSSGLQAVTQPFTLPILICRSSSLMHFCDRAQS